VQQLARRGGGRHRAARATLKFDGVLTLRLAGQGARKPLVAQCTHDFKVRAMARHEPLGGEAGFRSLAGEGQIVVTVEATDRASSYQGVVPITGNSLLNRSKPILQQSEQLPTRVLLAASTGVVSGMLVQRIPALAERRSSSTTLRSMLAWQKADDAMSSAGTRPAARRRRGAAARRQCSASTKCACFPDTK
jgi:redox-regulated HSP33 family molecular chaperone